MSHRKVVKDVNEGNIAPAPGKAVATDRGTAVSGKSRQDVAIRDDSSSKRFASALISAAGTAADLINKRSNERKYLKGKAMAGREGGEADAAALSKTLSNKLFGPDATLRGAQDQIIKTNLVKAEGKLKRDLAEFGHTMTPEEWEDHLAGTVQESTDKYADHEDVRNMLVSEYGDIVARASRDHAVEHEKFVQSENREVYLGHITAVDERAAEDYASGDPNRIQDAEDALLDALSRNGDMKEEAQQSALVSVVSRGLAEGRPGLYNTAEKYGMIGDLPHDMQVQLDDLKDLHDAKNDETLIKDVQSLDRIAATGDMEKTAAMAESIRARNPVALGKGGVKTYMDKAYKASVKQQEAQEAAREEQHKLVTSDPGLAGLTEKKQKDAFEAHTADIAERGLRQEMAEMYARIGEPVPADVEITPAQKRRWKLENQDGWAPQWAKFQIKSPEVTTMGKTIYQNINRTDITDESAQQIANDLGHLLKLREMPEGSEIFDKHFNKSEVALLTDMHEQINLDGQDPSEVLTRYHKLKERKASGEKLDPTKDQVSTGVDEIVERFLDEKGEQWLGIWDKDPSSLTELKTEAERLFTERFREEGDAALANIAAIAELNQNSAVINNKFILNGAKLDERAPNGNFDRYLEGLNDDMVTRAYLNAEAHGLPEDFDLRDPAHRVVAEPDGSAVTIYIETEGPFGQMIEKGVVIPNARTLDDIFPTWEERQMESLRENLLNSRRGGAFSSQQMTAPETN
jgi:hypothetical protein